MSAKKRLRESVPPADTLTILLCGTGFSASKVITTDDKGKIDIKGFNAGMFFGVMTRTVNNIEELSVHLKALENTANAFVIRGSPVKPDVSGTASRRLKANFNTPTGGKRWVMLDFDKAKMRGDQDILKDREAAIEHLVALLPNEFRDVTYHYQLSSSAGLGEPGTVSAHVWYWLSSPISDVQLKRWAKAVNEAAGHRLVDPALFNDVQPHYTAGPRFEGVQNPLPVRSGLVPKRRSAVNLKIPDAEALSISTHRSSVNGTPSAGFENRLAAIGDHVGGEGFHNAIIAAIASYVSENGRDKVDVEVLFRQVSESVIAADRSQHDDAYVDHMASRGHIMPAITGALEKFGDVPASRRRSRLVKGIAPPAKLKALSSSQAHAALSAHLDGIIGGKLP